MEKVYKDIDLFIKDIKKCENIVLAGHISPDGDAISSCLALGVSLEKLGKKPTILLESYERYSYLKGSHMIFKGDYDNMGADMFISLDCGDIKRLGQAEKVFLNAKKTVNIDHHITNDNFGDINIVNTDASSTCEIVYEIINRIGNIDKHIAEALYTGIVFDTSGFKHKSTKKRTYEVASKLAGLGIDNSFIHTELLYTHTFENARLLAKAIQNLQREGNTVITTLTKSEILNECSSGYIHLEGISGYMLDFKGIDVAVFLYEKENGDIKISFRSKDLDVNKIAQKYGGGGHILASGAMVSMPLLKAKQIMLKEIEKARQNVER